MPIGKQGSGEYDKFKDIYENLIKTTIEGMGLGIKCFRADENDDTGSIVKDILLNLNNAEIVIVDLSGRNANVFYELGVRHTFRKRSILIAQNQDDNPFDTNQYRAKIYKYPLGENNKEFIKSLKKSIEIILENPDHADNPVMDFVPLSERVVEGKPNLDVSIDFKRLQPLKSEEHEYKFILKARNNSTKTVSDIEVNIYMPKEIYSRLTTLPAENIDNNGIHFVKKYNNLNPEKIIQIEEIVYRVTDDIYNNDSIMNKFIQWEIYAKDMKPMKGKKEIKYLNEF